ncbi:Tricarboxylate carrier [Nesidiocoris tenuis]|uniref:Sidoreflexin n=1 Tax=Nesidiocoris tenuis TaxID=355587 RepID=A0ABN7AWI4_9HEMI|nr:Tricarboxylate carrier [Nesidiocoris tenuis]
MGDLKDVNLDRPRWDQSTYFGRARHFFTVANPLNLRYTSRDLDKAKAIVENHRKGLPQQNALTLDELWKAKHIYDSAFHPVTGEKIFILGRMSAQVPMNMIITGNMMLFYKTTPAVVFWQWVNQSFNALVNYCNRSDSDMPVSQIASSYLIATSGAVGSAVALNRLVKKMPPLVGRFVPFAAVAAANCVNIPAMRKAELAEGIKVIDENNNVIGQSKVAALEATISVVISRVIMAAPSMAVTPLVLNSLEKRGVFRRKPYLQPVLGLGITGLILTFATPLACALFAQTAPIAVGKLEPEIQEKIKKISPSTKTLYYNKGL